MTVEAKWGFQNVRLETNETCKPEVYCDILSDCASSFDMWEIKYYHSLPDHRALIEWVRGTRLRPYLACLDENGRAALEAELLSRAAKAYPLAAGKYCWAFAAFSLWRFDENPVKGKGLMFALYIHSDAWLRSKGERYMRRM